MAMGKGEMYIMPMSRICGNITNRQCLAEWKHHMTCTAAGRESRVYEFSPELRVEITWKKTFKNLVAPPISVHCQR